MLKACTVTDRRPDNIDPEAICISAILPILTKTFTFLVVYSFSYLEYTDFFKPPITKKNVTSIWYQIEIICITDATFRCMHIQ